MHKYASRLTFKLFAICLLIVLGCISIISALSYRYIEQETRANDEYYIQQMLSKLDQYLKLNYSTLQTVLYAGESFYLADPSDFYLIQRQLGNVYELNTNYLNNIYLIKEDLSIISGNFYSRIVQEPVDRRQYLYQQGVENKFTSISKPYFSEYSGWTITLTKFIRGSSPPVVVAIDLNLQAIEMNLLSINSQNAVNILIVDPEGRVIAGSPPEQVKWDKEKRMFNINELSSHTEISQNGTQNFTIMTTNLNHKETFTIYRMPSSVFNWDIVSLNDGSRLKKSLWEMQKYYVGLITIGFILSAFTALLITRYIRTPLFYLMKKMTLVKQGDFDVQISMQRKDEFGDLATTFELMIRKIKELIDDLNCSNELKRELEIQVLQAQINPHFLYNTLSAISYVVRLGQYDKVDTIVRSLISIFEYGVQSPGDKVTLQEELQNVEHYFQVQNIRYNRNFRLIVHVADEEMMDYPLFRMFLQPIVENSFFHGYSGGKIEGDIEIFAYYNGDQAVIDVIDHGVGMTEEQVGTLLLPSRHKKHNERPRIGLYNIHQRIQLNYGNDYGLTIYSEPDKGTCVRAIFPRKRNGEALSE